MFILLVLNLSDESYQLQLVSLLNLAMMSYNCAGQRVKNRYVHYQIVFNESCLMVIHVLMCIFTEWTDAVMHTKIGWVFIIIQTFMFLGNLPLIIYFGVTKAWMIIKATWIKAKHYMNQLWERLTAKSKKKGKIVSKGSKWASLAVKTNIVHHNVVKAMETNQVRSRRNNDVNLSQTSNQRGL